MRLEFNGLLAGSVGAGPLSASLASAEVPYTCGTGTLRDVAAVTETLPADTHTRVVTKTNKRGEREVSAHTSTGERHETTYFVTVELEDMSYMAQSAGNFWNFNPTRLVINDPIGLCVERDRIILRRPDGKDYKAKIVRAIRTREAGTPAAAPQSMNDRTVGYPVTPAPVNVQRCSLSRSCAPGPSIAIAIAKAPRVRRSTPPALTGLRK